MSAFVPQPTHRDRVPYGTVEHLAPQLRRVTANNPGAMTGTGTGTYLIGEGEVAVIDPGPADSRHIAAVLDALDGESIRHILITHTHIDHSPGAAILQQHTNAPTVGFGPHANRTGGSGDLQFVPDIQLAHGEWVSGHSYALECLHTPGHCANHLCFAEPAQQRVFCGDLMMGWSTTLISPPDGSIGDYLNSLALMAQRTEDCYWPTHGQEIKQVGAFIEMLRQHRLARISEVRRCVIDGIHVINEMVPAIYTDTDPSLYPIAAHSVLASLQYLVEQGEVSTDALTLDAHYTMT